MAGSSSRSPGGNLPSRSPGGNLPSRSSGRLRALKVRRDGPIRAALGVGDEPDQFDVGAYRVQAEIGAGSFGMVYRATDPTGRICALKLLLSQDSERRLKRFLSEARIAMRLDHPGIVKVHDVGQVGSVAWFAMDLIDGEDMQKALDRGMPRESGLALMETICRAVQHAHDGGVIHRDLKPANILIRRDGAPMLTDFGLAKDLEATTQLTTASGGKIMGTPYYIAPEQLIGTGTIDSRADVYALGVILYQVLTGKVPFVSDDLTALYRKVRDEDPPLPTLVKPDVSPEIEKVCLQALAKEPAERYASAATMADDIGRFIRGEQVLAKKPLPLSARAKRPRGGLSLRGAIFIGLFLGVVTAIAILSFAWRW